MPSNDTIPKWEDVTPIEDSTPKWEDVTPIESVKKKEEPVGSGVSESVASPSAVIEDKTLLDATQIGDVLKKAPLSFIFPHADEKVLDKTRNPLDVSGKTEDKQSIANPLPDKDSEEIAPYTNPKGDPSYFWGSVKAINTGTASFFKTLDNAAKTLEDLTGIKRGGGFGVIADKVQQTADQMPDVPDDRAGRLLRNVGQLEGIFLELAITPELKVAKIGAIPKLVTQMTGAGFVNSYADAMEKNPDISTRAIEGLKGAGVGLKDAGILVALGYGSALAGQSIGKAVGSEVIGSIASTMANAVGFSGSDLVQQVITNGDKPIDWNSVESNFDIGLALGVPEIAKSIGTRAMTNYFTSSPKAEKESIKNTTPVDQLRDEAIKTREAASGLDTETRAAEEAKANVIDGLADIKVISSEVAKDPEKFKQSIKDDETLTPEQKKVFEQKIDDTVELQKQTKEPEAPVVEPTVEQKQKEQGSVVVEPMVSEEEDLRIKELGRSVEEDQSKYINKISTNKFEAVNPFTEEKTTFKRKEDAAQYVFDLAVKARTKNGRIELLQQKPNEPILKPVEPQTKQKGVVVPSETKEGLKQQKEVVVGEDFKNELSTLKQEKPEDYWSVDMPTDEVIDTAAKNGKIIETEGGKAIVKEDGDIIGVYSNKIKSGVFGRLIDKIIKVGGKKLDNFDGYLTKTYEKNGFRVVAKMDFNEEYAPKDMPESEKLKKPDVVFMVYDPKGEMDIKEQRFGKENYDQAKEYRDSYLEQQKKQPIVGEQTIDNSQLNLKQNGKESSKKASSEKGRQDVLTEDEIKQTSSPTGISPKNLRDVYKAGREVFGLNKAQSLAQAIITDRIVGSIAKKVGKSKQQVYSEIEYRKADELLKQKAGVYFQSAWHGSPYQFDKFTTEKIGTGEGAQAFGWGLYFTDLKGIAEGYAKMQKASKLKISIEGVDMSKLDTDEKAVLNQLEKNFTFAQKTEETYDWVRKFYENAVKVGEESGEDKVVSVSKNRLSIVNKWDGKKLTAYYENPSQRTLYKVELHKGKTTEQYDWLVWDKKITDSNMDKINKQLSKENYPETITDKGLTETYRLLGKEKQVPYYRPNPISATGEQFYKDLEGYFSKMGIKNPPKEASLFLLRAGIDGIKYPAESIARGATSETARGFNYVVFDENAVTIEEVIKFQSQLQKNRGAMLINDGKAIIYALTDPNVSTPLHEVAHVYERYMNNTEKADVLKWTGDKEWTVSTSEKFARGFEKYLAEGVAPTKKLNAVFERFKTWLTDIYNGIKGSEIDVELNSDMKRLYDSIITGRKYVPSEEKVTVKATDGYKKTYNDVDDLLFQKSEVKFQEPDKTERHTKALENLIAHAEQEKVKDVAKHVNDYLAERGNPINQELVDKILKEKDYASEIGKTTEKGSSQEGVVEGTEGQVRVRNAPQNRMETGEGEVGKKQRGFQTGSMEKKGGDFAKIAKEFPSYYQETTEDVQLKAAAEWLDGKDEASILDYATSNKKTGTPEQRVNRKTLVVAYLSDQINKFVAEGDTERADVASNNRNRVLDSLGREGTELGQGLQAYAKFQRLTPEAVAWTVNNEIKKRNQSKFPQTDLKAVEESEKEIDKMSKDIANEAVESEKLNRVIQSIADKNRGKKQQQTYSEAAKQFADKLRKIKSSNWGITLAADPISSVGIGVLDGAVEVAAKTIEISGNIADGIAKGIAKIKRSDWYKGLSTDQKRKIERLFEVNVKKDLGVDSLSKGQLAKYLKTEIKDLKVSLKDVINKHWTDPNTLGITLSERIVSDLGLSKAEADLVEKTMSEIIRDMLDGKVVDYISGEALPKSKAQKSMFLDKMRDFLMVGKMDEKIYREIFAQKFGLTPDITKEEVDLITNLNKAVQATKNMGVFGDIVANEFAREIDKLIPKTRLQELFGGMIGLDYANALSGATTHYVNMKSVFFNLLARPIMDVTRFEDWVSAARRGEISELPIMNFADAWIDFAKAMGHGTTDLADIMKSGDLRAMHKYISDVKSIASLNVPELERHVYAKDRFKAAEFQTKFKGKPITIDVNAANYMKFVGRALAAEDALNYRGFEAVELASALRKKMQKQGFSKEEIKQQIDKQVFGLNLSEKESKEIEDQLAKEKADMASFGFKTDKFKDNRRRLELVRDKLLNFDDKELLDLREVAKGNVFNDTRGGLVNSVMATMSRFANKNVFTKLAIMPHFMFFRIAGNIGDFSIDTIPAYGSARARGWTPTTMFATYMKHRADGMSTEKAALQAVLGKRLSVSELPFKTAQLGDKGSYRYKQQTDRARIGNLMLMSQAAIIMGLYAMSSDDKDENGETWFDISGGRFFDKDIFSREAKLMPPYTIKIGDWKWRYGNAPIMTFGMSVIGNYADMVKAGLSEEEISDRLKLMSRSFVYSIGALTDQQLMQGFKSMFQSGLDLVKTAGAIKSNDESGENKPVKTITDNFMKYMAKEQLSPFTAWLPTKNNLFQQSLQAYTGTAVESKDIPSMLAYDLGIHHFTNNKAIDVLGNEVKRKAGYTGIYYEPAMIKDNPKAWELTQWLQNNGAYPATYYNRDEKYIYETPKSKGWLKDIFENKKPTYEMKKPTEDEFWQMRKLTGEMISKDLEKYKEAEYNGKKVWEIEAKEKSSDGKTLMQDKIAKYVNEAKQQTRLYLFTWKELGKSDPELMKTLYENKALPQYENKVSVYKKSLDGAVYQDENGNVVIKDKRELDSDALAKFNADVFKEYFQMMKGVKTKNPQEIKLLSDINWKTAVQIKSAMYNGE